MDDGPPKPVIAVSIFPVASLVGQLTDGWADVVTLLPDGASEHAFELTADQIRQVSRADLLVLVGNGLDTWAEPKPGMTADSKQPTVVRMGDLVGNLDDKEPIKPPAPDTAATNNHLWLDPVLSGRFVNVMASQLSSRYPAHRAEIERAATKLSEELKALDQKYRTELSGVQRREMVTFHNAFDLIAHRYGLVVVARLTDIESDPHGGITPASYLAAIKAINQYQLLAIYSEPEFPAQEISAIRRETAVEVLTLDPLGGPSIDGYRTYQQMMVSNLKTLVKGQGMESMVVPIVIPPNSKPGRSSGLGTDELLRIPRTSKQPKANGHPHFLTDPDSTFPRLTPTLPDHSVPDSSRPSFPSPFQP